MAFSMEITDSGRRNVVSNEYIHSNLHTFRNAVGVNNMASSFYIKDNDNYYKQIETKLISIKEKLQEKEEDFYQIFGITGRDSAEKAFNFNKLLAKSLERYKVLKKMNSPSFLKIFDNNFQNTIQKVVKIFEDDCKDKNININEILNLTDMNKFLENAFNFLNSFYPIVMGESQRVKLKKIYLKNGTINPEIGIRFSRILEKKFKTQVKNVSENSANQFFNNMLLYLNPDSEFKEILRRSFNKVKDKINFSVSDKRQQIGVIGEFQAQIFIDLLLDEVANNATKSFYIGNLTDKNTGKQSPTDFLINGYGIQVKNAEKALDDSGIGKFFDIHLQRNIGLDNFVKRLDSADREEFKYLIMNVSWLRNNGISDGKEEKLDINSIPMILEYINNILATNAQMLLHTEASKVLNKQGKAIRNTYGNTFFLLRGKYLVPVSVMIDGLIKTLREENQINSSGIGYFSRTNLGIEGKGKNKEARKISVSAIGSENPLEIYNKKHIILNDMRKRGDLKEDGFYYEGELLAYGAELGEQFSKQINIRVNYKFIIENLNKMKEYIIW